MREREREREREKERGRVGRWRESADGELILEEDGKWEAALTDS